VACELKPEGAALGEESVGTRARVRQPHASGIWAPPASPEALGAPEILAGGRCEQECLLGGG
jgi:hypothetical protein